MFSFRGCKKVDRPPKIALVSSCSVGSIFMSNDQQSIRVQRGNEGKGGRARGNERKKVAVMYVSISPRNHSSNFPAALVSLFKSSLLPLQLTHRREPHVIAPSLEKRLFQYCRRRSQLRSSLVYVGALKPFHLISRYR